MNLPPLITVQTLVVRGTWWGLLRIHKHLSDVQVRGLHVLVTPARVKGQPSPVMPLTNTTSGAYVSIGDISTDDALLEFLPRTPGRESFILHIRHLMLTHIGQKANVGYHAVVANAEPPGEVVSDGSIGPWNEDQPGHTPVEGSYTCRDADLQKFEGLGGVLSSRGSFSGTIGALEVQGEVDVAHLRLAGINHPVHLASSFNAVVDGTNGDTLIKHLFAHFRHTTLDASGSVAAHPEARGKTISLQVTSGSARVEDLLYLFTSEEPPAMTGSIRLQAHVEVPPGPPSFLRKMNVTGSCGIARSHFTNPQTQQPIDRLSESGIGEDKHQEKDDPQTVLSQLQGDVSAKGGVATLSHVAFAAPGTRADLTGTFNLLNRKVDLHGALYTDGKLSSTTTGFKALILKALSPFLRHQSITVVPFAIGGIAPNPTFRLDLAGKHHPSPLATR